MGAGAQLTDQFEHHRPYLRSVAYRMLGSIADAEDALQESWLRLDRRPPDDARDLRPWLTTVLGRICLDMLRARRSRREDYAGSWLPEPIVVTDRSPESEAVLADLVGLALLVVLETLTPAERLAFVLHDVFGVPFDEIARVVDRSPTAARQLASRARRRVQAARAEPDADLAVQRRVVDAFLAAARSGDFEALLRVLYPRRRPSHRRRWQRPAGPPARLRGRRCDHGAPKSGADIRAARPAGGRQRRPRRDRRAARPGLRGRRLHGRRRPDPRDRHHRGPGQAPRGRRSSRQTDPASGLAPRFRARAPCPSGPNGPVGDRPNHATILVRRPQHSGCP